MSRFMQVGSEPGVGNLTDAELKALAEALEWTSGSRKSRPVDTRGGRVNLHGLTITLDKVGRISSVSAG